MWLSTLWKTRNRFSLDELRHLTEQLMKVPIVNEVNKAFVIESLRSIAELMTYGDQHDAAFFEFFMEKQIMGEFVRLLKISKTGIVSLQLLQTMSIMIQNLKNEHSIYYMFSNEHINCLITYPFDFRNEELLSYYMSFLRAISGKLNQNTISLLVKTENDEVVAFPLYVEAIKFAFHEEGMIRTAVRALTLNIYHVGDEGVNRYVANAPHADYFLNLVKFFRDQCINLNGVVSRASEDRNLSHESISSVLSDVDEIEDNLYYFSDVISAGIPDVGRLITDNILKLLIFPLILPSLRMTETNEEEIKAGTSLYLICCILRIVKIKDLANTVAAALICCTKDFVPKSEAKINGHSDNHDFVDEEESKEVEKDCTEEESKDCTEQDVSSSSQCNSENNIPEQECTASVVYREALLSYITSGDDILVSGSLNVLATLLQTKELDESMLDALGILPQRKQQKKMLLQALVGEGSGEEQLFSSNTNNLVKDNSNSELDNYLEKLKDEYRLTCTNAEVGTSPRISRFQLLDALVSLFGRSTISAETLWDGGWLLRQLLPYSEAEFNSHHLKLIKDSFQKCARRILAEAKGTWFDHLISVLCDEWRKCKRAIEASSPRKDPKCILLTMQNPFSEDLNSSDSSYTAGAKMSEMVKVFVLLHQIHFFSLGRTLLDQPPVHPPIDIPDKSRAKVAGLDLLNPKPGTELFLVDAVPCRIAFERGKERHFFFLASSAGTAGWVILAEETPVKAQHGVIRIVAPLAGSNPRIDEKHSRWLHLCIRPSAFPFTDTTKYAVDGKVKTKGLVDGRWTLAFRDDETCKTAYSMIIEEKTQQSKEVERRLQPLLDLERTVDSPRPSQPVQTAFNRTHLNLV